MEARREDSRSADSITHRLKILEKGFTSCEIEGLPFTPAEKDLMRSLVKEGKTSEEMVAAIKKQMHVE